MLLTFLVAGAALVVPGIDRLRRKPRHFTVNEEKFHAAVHYELQAGASLRQALSDAAGDSPGLVGVQRAARAGRSLHEVAAALLALPATGNEARLAVEIAEQSGGAVADVFLRLADRAAAIADLDRQRRILTSQTRLSAAIVGGLPLAWLALGGVGRMQALIEGGGAGIALVGIAMETIGVAMVWKLAST